MAVVVDLVHAVMAAPVSKEALILAALAVGAASLASFALGVLRSVYALLLRPGKNLRKMGHWAVVTGATDGIGKAFCFELARKGLNILMISRTQSKLDDCAAEVKAKYPSVDVEVLAVDFSSFDEPARARVAGALAGKTLAVLINNVGVSYPFCMYQHELSDDDVKGLIELNVNSTTWMTRLALPSMLERRRGVVVNISSTAGVVPSPLLALYSAAKSYVEMYTRAMDVEYSPKGVRFQCQIPLFVATKLAKIRHTSLTVPSPAGYARAAVRAIGYETVTSPFLMHALQLWAVRALPDWLQRIVMRQMHLPIRAAGMKKRAKAAAAAGGGSKKDS